VHVLTFLRQHGCPMGERAVNAAASADQVPALRWLHQHFPAFCLKAAWTSAAAHGSIEAMAYLLPHIEQSQFDSLFSARMDLKPTRALTAMLNIAGCNHQLAAAKWLRQQGAAWPTVLCHNFKEWSGAALAWAREEGCTSLTDGLLGFDMIAEFDAFSRAPTSARAAGAPRAREAFTFCDEPPDDPLTAQVPLSALPPDHPRVQR
jgi:hypothetical protein